MADTRFSIPKVYGTSAVAFFNGEQRFSIPVNGIDGLASYGFVSLLEAQLVGGPKTPEYVSEVAANLSVYLATAWKPGDSAGIMRRKFQLARALVVVANRKNKSKTPIQFDTMLPRIVALTDADRQAMWLLPQVQGLVSEWNAKGERKSVDVSAAFKSLTS